MKFVPDAIARKVASQQLLASQHAPRILFVGGVVGMVGSTVLACRATLKVEEVLDGIESEKRMHTRVHESVNSPNYDGDQTYSEEELKHDNMIVSVRGIGQIAKLYAPAVVLGGISIAALTKSHNILRDRNLALAAAYTTIDRAFHAYRERVIDRYGEDVDRELRYDYEEVDILDEETGKIHSTNMVVGAPGSEYARWFDTESSSSFSPDPDINLLFLRSVQNWANERLRARGHVFLNEVYADLGLTHTMAGSVVGWRWNQGSGDDYIDFGIFNGGQVPNDFFNGREGAILLDFNVDGVIYDKLESDGA